MDTLKDMKFLKKITNFNFSFIVLEILALLIVIWFVWLRFIRERLPRDIPFNLSIWSFIALVIICISYIFLIYRIIRPKENNFLLQMLNPILTKTSQPFVVLNNKLLTFKYTQNIIRFLLKALSYLNIMALNVLYKTSLYIYNIVFIVSRLVFIIFFYIDCFYFQQLNLIYSCMFVITFPLLTRYLLYCAKFLKELDLKLLEHRFLIEITSEDFIYKPEDYDEEGFLKDHLPRYNTNPSELDYDDIMDGIFSSGPQPNHYYKYLEIPKFIDHQTTQIYFNSLPYEYKILFREERKDLIYLGVDSFFHAVSKNTCHSLIEQIINNDLIHERLTSAIQFHVNDIKNLNLIVYILLSIGWCYILIKSSTTLSMKDLLFIIYFYAREPNPFLF